MVEKIDTGSKWAWILSPAGVRKAEQRRSKNRQRDFRRHLEDRYSGEEREEPENASLPGETTGADEPQAVEKVLSPGGPKTRGKLIDIHA